MTICQRTTNDDNVFWISRVLQEQQSRSQTTLAEESDSNVSLINSCLKASVEKVLIKRDDFSKNSENLSHDYFRTFTGVAEKTVLTNRFSKRKMDEIEILHRKVDQLSSNAQSKFKL